MGKRKGNGGYSLIEVMMALVLVAAIPALAAPFYPRS
jgi:prepilin-type N-terminal cleavage/methylation domain-containing protein